MKKLFKILICTVFFCALMICSASAKLTDAQKDSLVDFTEDFIEQGNAKKLLQYGSYDTFITYQLGLVHCEYSVKTSNGGQGQKVLWMMRPSGYANFEAYKRDLNSPYQGYFKEGDYLVLDCSAFVALMYKSVLGLRLDYGIAGHVSNWTTSHYLLDEYQDQRKVLKYDGSGEEIDLFEVLATADLEAPFLSLLDTGIKTEELEVGDLLIGLNQETNWGHIVMYAGDGYVYHSSSTPYVLPDGSLHPYLIRKEPLSNLNNPSYSLVKVMRLNDGVLNPDFDGYHDKVDFSSLNTTTRAFDTKAPEILSIKISNDFVKGNTKQITIDVTDEFGDGSVTYFAGSEKKVLRGSANGESGVMGIYMGVSQTLPETTSDFDLSQATHYEILRARGQYYIWAMDAARNISERYRIIVGKDTSFVYRSPEDGEEVLLATYKAGEDGAVTEGGNSSDGEKTLSSAWMIGISVISAVVILAVVVIVLVCRKKHKKAE